MTFDLPFLWSPALSCTGALLPCTFLSSHTGRPGYWGWQQPDRNTNIHYFKTMFQIWGWDSIIFTQVQPQDFATAAKCHWSGERVINEEEGVVQKQEVIMVGCNLIPISCMMNLVYSGGGRLQRSPLISDSERLWWPCGQSGRKGRREGMQRWIEEGKLIQQWSSDGGKRGGQDGGQRIKRNLSHLENTHFFQIVILYIWFLVQYNII